MVRAVFLLFTAAGAPFGSMTTQPMTEAECNRTVADADQRQKMADMVKQHTGVDVRVKGICQWGDDE